MSSSKEMTAAWFDTSTLIQHSNIGSLGKWDGLLILYRGLIKIPLYYAALLKYILIKLAGKRWYQSITKTKNKTLFFPESLIYLIRLILLYPNMLTNFANRTV